MLTPQEIFDIVAKHLLTQNEKSIIPVQGNCLNPWKCLYHSPDGKKCAIGVLIPDKEYKPAIENSGDVRYLINYHPSCPKSLSVYCDNTQTMMLLEELQGIHDEMIIEDWINGLLVTALNFNLDNSVLRQFQEKSVS